MVNLPQDMGLCNKASLFPEKISIIVLESVIGRLDIFQLEII